MDFKVGLLVKHLEIENVGKMQIFKIIIMSPQVHTLCPICVMWTDNYAREYTVNSLLGMQVVFSYNKNFSMIIGLL